MRLEIQDIADLKPIIRQVVHDVLDEIRNDESRFGDRIGFSESEAAGLLGVLPHVLADCRRRGEISARKVGKSYRYSRQTLIDFLETQE